MYTNCTSEHYISTYFFLCVFVCLCVGEAVCVSDSMYACMYACMYVCASVCVCPMVAWVVDGEIVVCRCGWSGRGVADRRRRRSCRCVFLTFSHLRTEN